MPALKRLLPPRLRARLKDAWLDLPARLRDVGGDLADLRRPRDDRLPPARLRRRVARGSSRAEFLAIGARVAADVRAALALADPPVDLDAARWLDFGSGCGRVARHLLAAGARHYTAVDVDRSQVSWAARHLPGTWRRIAPRPPLPFAAGAFDLVVSISVFTHLDEAEQLAWLAELRRVMHRGGVLLASTHGPRLGVTLPPPHAVPAERIERAGIVHVTSARSFNARATFHSRRYLESTWSAFFAPVAFLPAGLDGYQDLSLWRAGDRAAVSRR